MTDYSPSALNDLKKKIWVAAVRLYLIENGWAYFGDMDNPPFFYADGWTNNSRLPGVDGPTGTVRLTFSTRPLMMASQLGKVLPGMTLVDPHGRFDQQEGAQVYDYDFDAWTGVYKPWQDRIYGAFEGWDNVPDPANFDGLIQSVRGSLVALTPMPTGTSIPNGSGGDLAPEYANVDFYSVLTTMEKWLDPASDRGNNSAAVMRFSEKYGTRVRPLLFNHAKIATVLGVAIQGEKTIWQKAREDIMRIADDGVPAFRLQGNDSIDWGVLKALWTVAEDFLPPEITQPIDTGIKVTGDVLDLWHTVKPPQQHDDRKLSFTGSTADEIATNLTATVTKLNQSIWDQEHALDQSLQATLDQIHDHPASDWHINAEPGIDPEFKKSVTDVHINSVDLQVMGFDYCTTIAASWGKAAEDLVAADKSTVYERDWRIGYGVFGAYDSWSEVKTQVDAMMTGSGHELVEAGKLLAAFAGAMTDTDGYTAENLKGVQDDINRGTDGYDNSSVGVPPPDYYRLPSGKMIPF